MFDLSTALWLIPGLPLVGAAAAGLLGPVLYRNRSHSPVILAALASAALSFMVLLAVRGAEGEAPQAIQSTYTWFQAGKVDVRLSLRADALTAIMLVTVTSIGSLIAIYATGYMHGDPGYPRFFAAVSLFLAAMTTLVLANNFIVLYAGWEGVGLCSYLLIGFWFEKPSAAAAARKAFLVTRIGDVGLFLGVLLAWSTFGTLEFFTADGKGVFDLANTAERNTLTVICLLLFCGAVGKSGQFPLHVWLPDAMEGPTPVSALIHAATMVTAGVYLVARCTPLFVLAPDAQLVVAVVGGVTALLAGLIALTQNDLKRVLAYSTVSQLGYMFLALGSGLGRDLGAFAAAAAIFHLFTHAFFKALLFLAAGSVMHAMGNVIDMRRFGGLRHVLRHTHAVFLCGALALAGFPLLSGFWSKDEILLTVWNAAHDAHGRETVYFALFVAALVTAGLTAFYTFRAYFLTFWGAEHIPHEAGHHAHESPPVMVLPMALLAIGAVATGALFGPTHLFAGFLGRTPGVGVGEAHHAWWLPVVGGAVALAGMAVAYAMYVRNPDTPGELAKQWPGLYQLSLNRFGIDEIYALLVVRPLTGFAELCRWFDARIVDQLVDLTGHLPGGIGRVFRPIQNGLVQFYALAMMLCAAVFLVAMLLRW